MNTSSDSDKNNIIRNFPIDLAQKIAMVKPTDKGATVQTQQTFRTITQPQMRMIAMPAGTVQTSGTAQIIQTHIMPQTMLKQVEASTRAQITPLPSRSQGSSITVSRAPTASNFVPRGPTITNTNLRGTLSTPIRTPTPPTSVTSLGAAFVRGTVPPKTQSPAGATVLSPGSTQAWLSTGNAVQVQVPTQIIRATNITAQSPRQQQSRMISQNSSTTTISSNNNSIANSVSQNNQLVASQNPQQQAFVATLATVLPSRQPAATLVYSNISNPQQQYGGGTQRLAVATSLGGQRQVRPIQLTNARLPTTGMGIRVSTANISIRAPSVPVLTPTSVLTSLPSSVQGRATVSTTNLSTSIPTARIIQVQQPQSGGAQVINAKGFSNVMTLQPVIINTNPGGNRMPATLSTKVQPSLTITHVKSTVPGNTNVGSITVVSQSQANQQNTSSVAVANSGPNQHTLASQQQIAQIVSVNQQGGVVNQGHQIVTVSQQQLMGNQNQGIATVVPVAINSRTTNVLTGTITSIQPQSIANTTNRAGNLIPVSSGTTILPIAKVLPQQQQQMSNEQNINTVTSNASVGQQVLIHARSPSSVASGIAGSGNTTTNVLSSSGTFLPTSGTFYYEHSTNPSNGNQVLTLTTTSVNPGNTGVSAQSTNIPNNLGTSVAYAPSSGSFAVVPANNRTVNQIHGIVPSSNQSHTTAQLQSVPVRFNPQLLVDGSQSHQGTHQIITMSQPTTVAQNTNNSGINNINSNQQQQQQQTHVLIPVTAKLASSPRPSILKKRENDHSPSMQHHGLKAAKNLGPTLLSMSSSNDREHRESLMDRERDPSPQSRPGSSEGSTTVSATSSPGIDQQEQEEMQAAMSLNMRLQSDMQFKPVETAFSSANIGNSHLPVVPHSSAPIITNIGQNQIQHQVSTGSSGAENNNDMTPRKKPRKQQLDASDNLEPNLQYMNEDATMYSMENNVKTNNLLVNNKENAQPVELTIKKPRTSLLENYKQSWKPANNHFQRYSDVKPREERRPNVMDLANQAHVVQKVNGWKIYHLSSQMEDLCELESQVHTKLSNMLQFMEAHEPCPDIERVNDLIKGNMQRSKVIIDGVNEARSQIMKIFDHKTHVSDIIHRCASKRNFKKREKL